MTIKGILQSAFILSITAANVYAQNPDKVTLQVGEDEYWWGGLTSKGSTMPFTAESDFEDTLIGENFGNQAQPLLISNKGRYIWSEEPFKFSFKNGKLTVETEDGEIISTQAGETLESAFEDVSSKYFPSNGVLPDQYLFTNPQYNTWIELMYDQNEEDILKYAQTILDKGYPAGVLMIDDNWQEDYGVWEFSAKRFNDPKDMIKKLHEMGFKVMLWICPFVSPDCLTYRELAAKNVLILDQDKKQNVLWANTTNKPAMIRWWNGASACVDFSNPEGAKWFQDQLDYLAEEYGVDGFKFDAGDTRFYHNTVSYGNLNPNEHTVTFAEFGLKYPLNEYRAAWKMAGQPLVQRLRDKTHDWGDLRKLIPDLLSQGIMGYAYTCPDMIGGGEYQSFLSTSTIDQELVVRSAQIHALMPMMQFSVAPWRVLSKENEHLCLEAAKLHTKFAPVILELAKAATKSGVAVVRHMAYEFPGCGYENIKDQFMLGDKILVAPVVEKGASSRKVVLPKGVWMSDEGKKIRGGKTIEVDTPLERLPYFTRVK